MAEGPQRFSPEAERAIGIGVVVVVGAGLGVGAWRRYGAPWWTTTGKPWLTGTHSHPSAVNAADVLPVAVVAVLVSLACLVVGHRARAKARKSRRPFGE